MVSKVPVLELMLASAPSQLGTWAGRTLHILLPASCRQSSRSPARFTLICHSQTSTDERYPWRDALPNPGASSRPGSHGTQPFLSFVNRRQFTSTRRGLLLTSACRLARSLALTPSSLLLNPNQL
ncbi:hypothetical protein N656DRAFT_195212 [Canariomyces notabilis]|uniref:Uncharacterized protein n=1 Tax=Canariomyces notabilis TaxID=2074819 RepID=A0AAN6QI70_9PEZI|nr:hypothetical protein N656DRAFT_195212 [Canariomyces arenarius]